FGINDVKEYETSLLNDIVNNTDYKVIFSKKKTNKPKQELENIKYDYSGINNLFSKRNVYSLVTLGSNCSFDALVMDIPYIVLGENITKLVGGSSLSDLPNIKPVSKQDKQTIFNMISYYQYTTDEIRNIGFDFIKGKLNGSKN